jgi:hypothetical protein
VYLQNLLKGINILWCTGVLADKYNEMLKVFEDLKMDLESSKKGYWSQFKLSESHCTGTACWRLTLYGPKTTLVVLLVVDRTSSNLS